jgi:phosphoribosylglycinamide formyltransferase-1
LPIAVLISGGGSTLKNLFAKIDAGELEAEVRLVVSSNPAAKGIEYAAEAGVGSCVVEKTSGTTSEEFREAVFQPCRDAGVELVVMGGFLKHVLIPADFENRVVNIHPGLIPAFCGKGFYGLRVHQAVLDQGVKITGCTVHFVDDEYDHGPIILQRAVEVAEADTAETLQQRVMEQERRALPEAIQLIASGRVKVTNHRVQISP